MRAGSPVLELLLVLNRANSSPTAALFRLWIDADWTGNWNSGGGATKPPVEVAGGTLNIMTAPACPLLMQWPAVRYSLAAPFSVISHPVHPVLSRPTRGSL